METKSTSCRTGPCQWLQNLWAQAPRDDRLKATLPARVLAVLSLRANDKNPRSHRVRKHLKNGISRLTCFREVLSCSIFAHGQSEVSVNKFCTEAFPGTVPDAYEVKCEQCSDNSHLLFHFKVACQQFVAAHSSVALRFSSDDLVAVRKSAEVFVREARALEERQMGKRLAPP